MTPCTQYDHTHPHTYDVTPVTTLTKDFLCLPHKWRVTRDTAAYRILTITLPWHLESQVMVQSVNSDNPSLHKCSPMCLYLKVFYGQRNSFLAILWANISDIRIKPLLSHTPLSYCCYVCQAYVASTELTLSLAALPGEILSTVWKKKKVISDRRSVISLWMINTGS